MTNHNIHFLRLRTGGVLKIERREDGYYASLPFEEPAPLAGERLIEFVDCLSLRIKQSEYPKPLRDRRRCATCYRNGRETSKNGVYCHRCGSADDLT